MSGWDEVDETMQHAKNKAQQKHEDEAAQQKMRMEKLQEDRAFMSVLPFLALTECVNAWTERGYQAHLAPDDKNVSRIEAFFTVPTVDGGQGSKLKFRIAIYSTQMEISMYHMPHASQFRMDRDSSDLAASKFIRLPKDAPQEEYVKFIREQLIAAIY